MGKSFLAKKPWVGTECYVCSQKIQEKDSVRFYGGPFLIHETCIEKIVREAIDGHGDEENQ
jgi:hypothetical protein